MIDPNNQNNLNPQDVSNPVDPNFLPKDSNVYIRTMNADLNNLKNQGGETLPYVENPMSANNFNNLETPMPVAPINNADFNTPSIPQIPVTNFETPPKPEINIPEIQNTVNVPNFANPVPVIENNNPNTLEDIKDKINKLNQTPEQKPVDANVNNLSANLSSDLNNFIMPEEFSPMVSVETKQPSPKSKSKIIMLAGMLGLVIIILILIFVVRPKMLSPKISVKTNDFQSLLMPATTLIPATTTKPSPFIMLKNGFQLNNLDIDISKSPEIVNQIKAEANVLLAPNDFKVVTAKIKSQFLTVNEIMNAFIDNIPVSLVNGLEEKYLIYSFYGEVHPALGLIFKAKPESIEQIKADFLTWETNKNIIKSTADIWLFSPKTPTSKTFKDGEYLGAKIRHFDYPGKEASFSYAFYENNIIISTSIESINSAINYLQNGDTPIIR